MLIRNITKLPSIEESCYQEDEEALNERLKREIVEVFAKPIKEMLLNSMPEQILGKEQIELNAIVICGDSVSELKKALDELWGMDRNIAKRITDIILSKHHA